MDDIAQRRYIRAIEVHQLGVVSLLDRFVHILIKKTLHRIKIQQELSDLVVGIAKNLWGERPVQIPQIGNLEKIAPVLIICFHHFVELRGYPQPFLLLGIKYVHMGLNQAVSDLPESWEVLMIVVKHTKDSAPK